MHILVHLGLNKCASTYIQQALAASRDRLRGNGTFYAVEDGRPAQYGVSLHYGFGPDAGDVVPRDLAWLLSEARAAGCTRVVLSSEYLSLRRPGAITAFATDLERTGAEARFLLYTREVTGWVQSLFNQYVKTVETGPCFESINGFIDHVLANGAIDIAGRYGAWAEAVGAERLVHHHIAPGQPRDAVLRPFSGFCGAPVLPAPGADGNESLSPGALYLTALLRQVPKSVGRDRPLARIGERNCGWVPVPAGYLDIDADHRARLAELVARPLAELPRQPLQAAA